MKRLTSIDAVRGIVMIVMALDHVRDMMHVTSIAQNPTDLTTTTPFLFFSRWITHICAPTFVFLSGTSAYLYFRQTNDIAKTRQFLISRGLWLILVEFTVVNFGLWFDPHFSVFLFDVIATIGFGFVVLGFSLKVSPRTLGIVGLTIIFCHNLIALIPFSDSSVVKAVVTPFFAPMAAPIFAGSTFVMGYPPIPWLGIILLGFALGKLFELEPEKRKALFLKIGGATLTLFVLIRAVNIYGDSFRWSYQADEVFTFLSFVNVTKYPPSLAFCLLTLGGMFLILAFATTANNKLTEIAVDYGRVPLFYFIVHFYLIHLLTFAMIYLQGFKVSDMVFGFNFGRPKEGSGVDLWAIYLIWITLVIVLYPICKWYGKYKADHREKVWLRYL